MTAPIVLTLVVCPVCRRRFEFERPVSLRRLGPDGSLYHTDDGDGLPDLWVSASSDREAIARLARTICETVAKYGGDGITTHYTGRLT